ncbi:uncharacterized protein LOC134214211 [Armigeres subalbatus]|uniref:uncharacterized protein LOC134214211 n=1 Tax=Armigeres subalbatus TaxID=124917 RepID=UPI002ED45B54
MGSIHIELFAISSFELKSARMKTNLFRILTQFLLIALVGCSLVNAAPLEDESETKLSRVVRQTTYKYQEAVAAYTFSPFAPKTSPTTTTTTTTPIPVTTKRPWYKLWR